MKTETTSRLTPTDRIGSRLRQRLFGIPLVETSCARRGFQVSDPDVRARLERIGQTFLHGYHAAINDADPTVLAPQLDAIEAEFRGFAFEGAAMALALLDHLTPWSRHRLPAFLAGPGALHVYMAHVGAGWAYARLCRYVERPLSRHDPLLRWLAIDGYGFHEGYFNWRHYLGRQARPARLSAQALPIFDQGLGRSLWFVKGADIAQISATIATFAPERRGDLWSGVALACGYAGGVEQGAIAALRETAGPTYHTHLAQGAAFAAKARQRAGNPAPHTEMACATLCGLSAGAAAAITDQALENLHITGQADSYELWRQRIRAQFAEEAVRL